LTGAGSTAAKWALALLTTALVLLLVVSVRDVALSQWLFVNTTYYFLMLTLLCWLGVHVGVARNLTRQALAEWLKENWPGLAAAAVVTLVAALAVEPALRMLSDEANLVGTSKNLFASKTATFTVSGKNYYDSYWDIDVAIDQRPALFPFLVSLAHAAVGYSFRNAFSFNLLVLPAFLLVAYRLGKSLGGETFGLVALLLFVAHPIILISIRSGGFDFFATFCALLVLKSVLDFVREPSPVRLASLWLNACLFAEVRYESALFIPPLVALLWRFGLLRRSTFRPYVFLYALTPAYLLPRAWQSVVKGNIPEQEPGAVTFSIGHLFQNAHEYFKPIFSPADSFPAHSAVLIALGVVGCLLWLRGLLAAFRGRPWQKPSLRFAVCAAVWLLLQAAISFSYVWGRAQYPSAARLFIPLDCFFSFAAAWALVVTLRRLPSFVAVLLAASVFVAGVPIASQHRLLNRLTQTRESSTEWKFFERLGEKRILIVTDRPNLFTIMNYGAMSFENARSDPYLFTALGRHLFYDVYVIQQLALSTNQPLPGFEFWSTRKLDTVLEFQNDADVLIRVSRVSH